MYDLDTIQRRNRKHVYAEARAALALNTREGYARVHKLARANPDLFLLLTRDPEEAYAEAKDAEREYVNRLYRELADHGGEG